MRTSGFRVAIIAAALALFAPVRAWAFDCDSKVVDEAGAFTGGDLAAVEKAVVNLENAGAEVRVRTVLNMGGPGYASLDAYKAALMHACPSWQAADNPVYGMKNNLVVFMVSLSRNPPCGTDGARCGSGLYHGDQWRAQLDGPWPSFLVQNVRPLLREKRNGDAVVAALNGVAGFIKPQPTAERTNGPVTVDNRKPTDLTGLWWVLGAIVLIGLGVLVFLVLRSRKREREARQAAQQKAQATKANCAKKIAEFTDMEIVILESEIDTAASAASAEDAKPLRDKLAEFKKTVEGATIEFNELQNSKNDPGYDDYAIKTYADIDAAYGRVLGDLRKAETLKNGLKDGAAALQKLIGEVPAKIEAAKAAIAEAETRRKAVKDKGFKTPASDTQIAATVSLLKEAQTAQAGKRFGAAAEAADKTVKAAGIAARSAEEMPTSFDARQASVAALKRRIAASRASIEAARPVFAAIQGEYAESCWDTINRNGSASEHETEEAESATAAAAESATMEVQDWDGAKTCVDGANASLERAESLIRSIHVLKANLETAKRDARGELDLAAKDIAVARGYIAQHDEDVREKLEADLDAVEKRLKGAYAEIVKDKPDYLEIIEAAKASNAAADKILADARTEFEAMEAKRARASSAKRDASAAISKTAEYIEDHSSDVGVGARNELASARRQLERVGSVASATAVRKDDDIALAAAVAALDAIVKDADGAKSTAEAALKAAKADYRRAEDVREEERAARRRAAEAAARAEAARQEARDRAERASRPSSTSSFPSFPKIGGGSSGRSSSGGGGSISTGRSSSGGGGSVGW